MKLEHADLDNLKRRILEIIGRYVDLRSHKVFFFGSRVSGKSDEHSDIDVGIEGKEPLDFSVMAAIRYDIEGLPVLYKIDVVDFTSSNANFQAVAKQHIEYIN
jgi:predicted nucleotidyltransferase